MAKKDDKNTKAKAKRGRNWDRLKREWFDSGHSARSFCRYKKIPWATGKRYFVKADRDEFVKKAGAAAESFVQAVGRRIGQEDEKLRVKALQKVMAVAEEILIDSATDFKGLGTWNSKGEAARISLSAGETLRELSNELSGLPPEGETITWPLLAGGFSPFPYQRDFLFDFPSTLEQVGIDAFIFAFLGGVGAGKTRIGAEKFGILAAKNRGLPLCVYAPTYRMLEDATKATFIKTLVEKGIDFSHKKTDNVIWLWGDTPVYFRSLDDPEHLRGPEYAAGWIDEGLQMPTRYAFDVVLARIREPRAVEKCLLFTGSKAGLNWGYDLLETDRIENKVRTYVGRTQDNPLQGEYYERLLGIYDAKLAAQELDAEWIDIYGGRAYWNFSRTENVIPLKKFKIDKGLPLILVVDFNVDPMAWNIGQERAWNGDKVTYFFDEIHIQTAGTEVAAREFLRRYKNHRPGVRVFGDATGRSRATSATRTDYEIIEQELKREMAIPPDMNVGRSNPRVTDRVAAVNARLQDARLRRKLYFTDNCKETIRDFERAKFLQGTRELDKRDSSLTHHTDAVGYYINREFPIRGPRVRIGRR